VLVASDISKLRGERDRFVAFSFAAADLLMELDSNGKVTFVSGATKVLTGLSASQLIGVRLIDIVDSSDKAVMAYVLEGMREGDRITPIAMRMKDAEITAILGACKLSGMNGNIQISLNSSGLPAAQAVNLQRDSETGVLDSAEFLKLADDQLSLAAETGQNLELTLMKVDGLDEMRKRTSDEDMDEFLHKFGAILRGNSLGGDSVGKLSDEKFGVVHGEAMDGNSIVQKVSELAQRTDPKGNIEISQNAVSLDPGSLSRKNAAQALLFTINNFADESNSEFEIKSLADGLQRKVETTINRINNLKNTFRSYDFELVYQPIVELQDKETSHYEILSRFTRGESPYEIITFSEQVGIIHDLDLAVAKKVKDKCRDWTLNGYSLPRMAMNISGHSIESDNFIDTFQALFSQHSDIRSILGIEITETSQINDLARAERVIQMLRKEGYEIYLDDMGTGSASFEYIRALNVDYVKIDGSYVKDVLINDKDAMILKAMSRLCRDLKVGTVAEMVETKEQMIKLKSMGIEYGQGWYFSKPLDEPELQRQSKPVSMNLRRKGARNMWG
jgi:EAL domain-containing protein (putative c-di-GMP-specific phosphodiesterase class I)/PAS domain-containing protein